MIDLDFLFFFGRVYGYNLIDSFYLQFVGVWSFFVRALIFLMRACAVIV